MINKRSNLFWLRSTRFKNVVVVVVVKKEKERTQIEVLYVLLSDFVTNLWLIWTKQTWLKNDFKNAQKIFGSL